MSITDPIADFLTRIRNGLQARKTTVDIPRSNPKVEMARILKEEGYIIDYRVEEDGPKATIIVTLKYGPDGNSIIRTLRRVSSPGRRVYKGSAELKPVINGIGIAIISTSKGMMTDVDAREQGVGGEVLCEVH